jgi:cytochrome c-type biogenesis protein CcmH/NrfG
MIVGFIAGVVFQAYRSGSVGEQSPVHRHAAMDPVERTRGETAPDLEAFEAMVAAQPESAEAWMHLGNAYFDADRHEDAIRAYEKSLKIDPSDANVWTDLGVMYRRAGRPLDAVEAFDRAIEADPAHEASRFNKGIVLLHDLEDPSGAVAAWEALLRINPTATTADGRPVSDIVKTVKGP